MTDGARIQGAPVQPSAWRILAIGALPVLHLLVFGASTGCNQILGVDKTKPCIHDAYSCECTCDPGGIDQTRIVCLPPALNPELNPTPPPVAPSDLKNDCGGRVQKNVEQMARQCVAATATCTCKVPTVDLVCGYGCGTLCTGEDLAADCSNFPPGGTSKTATNAPGKDPVCLSGSSDPPDPAPDPLAAGVFAHTSSCEVTGNVTITRNGDTQTQAASGTVEFTGAPCPDASCQVGMSYRLDHIDNFNFSGFGGFDNVEFQNLSAFGASLPAAATVDRFGTGSFAPNSAQTLGQGKRSNQLCVPEIGCGEVSSDEAGYTGGNGAPIDVTVDWTNHSCAVSGALLGSLEGADTIVQVALTGTIVNEPPTANAGRDTTVECTSAAGAGITLDGTGSTDPENNIALYVWRHGSRAGDEVGEDAMVSLNQALGGSETYFLRVVDALGQSSEDSTVVSVVDSTPPTIASVTATPNVLQPPDHQMVGVNVAVVASDLCSSVACRITRVSSNEPVNGLGDGDTSPDWQITGDLTANLRAERSGTGSGRVYTLTVTCSDASGNSSTGTAMVTVPHNS